MARSAYCPACFTTFEGDPEACSNMMCGRARPRVGWSHLLVAGDYLDRHYLIDGMLAVGGAGVTYRAREVDSAGQPAPPDLAIKVLHTRRATGAFLQRLSSEAQILQGLRNDHIVECLGFVQRHGQAPYLVTRFEAGGTLEELVMERGPLAPWTVAGVMRQIMEALAAAHRKGVVHRDLKPANILLRKKTARVRIPHVRVADFGIAKVGGGLTDGLTRMGAFIGTPHFAAPEQFLGRATGSATDVFAAGALAFWLLTGRVYFQDPDSGALEDYPDAILDALPPQLPQPLLKDERGRNLAIFLADTMRVDPEQRWNLAEAIEFLDWMLGVRPQPPTWLGREPDPEARPTEPGVTGPSRLPPNLAGGAPLTGRDRGAPSSKPIPTGTTRVSGTSPTLIRPPRPAVARTPARRTPAPAPAPAPALAAPRAPTPAPPPSPRRRVPRATAAPAPPPKSIPPRPSAVPRTPARRGPAVPVPGPRVGRTGASRSDSPVGTARGAGGSSRGAGARPAGAHPDDPWPPKDQGRRGQTLSLEDALGTPSVSADESTEDEISVPYEPPEAGPIEVRAAGDAAWLPLEPMPLPHPLPAGGPDLLRVLGAVAPAARRGVTRRLLQLSPEQLVSAVRAYAPGGDPAWGRGVGLAVELLRRDDWEPVARSLLSDPEPGVRVAAAAGLARVGDVVTLKTLSNLLGDDEPQVRIAAVRALATCAKSCGRGRVAQYALKPLLEDAEVEVADAVELALVDLE
jgi:eukaryotic-like serine/threonine-protein kinase